MAFHWSSPCQERGFPDSSVAKESSCNAGDPGSIPGLGRSPGERIGYPLHYSWASLVAQLVKNPPAMWRPGFDPWVGKIPWRRESLPTPIFWPGEFHDCIVHGVTKSWTRLNDFHTHFSRKEEVLLFFLLGSTFLGAGLPQKNPSAMQETIEMLVWPLGRYPGKGNGNPLLYSCLGNSKDGGAWWATV